MGLTSGKNGAERDKKTEGKGAGVREQPYVVSVEIIRGRKPKVTVHKWNLNF